MQKEKQVNKKDMKNKILIFIAILFLSVNVAQAQYAETGSSSVSILGGINFQNINGKNSVGKTLENSMIIGFHVGAAFQIPIAPDFYFQPGLLLSTKGAENKSDTLSTKYQLTYLELPLNIVYKATLGTGKFMLGFGPYLAYGIGGKVTSEDASGKSTTKVKFKSTVESSDPFGTPYFKPLDVGGNIFVGYVMSNNIILQLNTQFGLVNINPKDNRIANDESVLKNTGFGVSIGYSF